MIPSARPVRLTQLRFSGSVAALQPYYRPGLLNKRPLVQADTYVARPDVDEQALLAKLTDPEDNTPMLLTGSPRSGKSVLALRLMDCLERSGEKVLCFENRLGDDPKLFTSTNVAKLKKELALMTVGQRLYLFMDEPQIIPALDFRDRPSPPDMNESVLAQLQQLVSSYPNFKLIGIAPTDADKIAGNVASGQMCDQFRALFPASHYVMVPAVTTLDPDVAIQMTNNGLASAGFLPLHPVAVEALKGVAKKEPLDVRVVMAVLAALIAQFGCNGEVGKPEALYYDLLTMLPETLLYNLRKLKPGS